MCVRRKKINDTFFEYNYGSKYIDAHRIGLNINANKKNLYLQCILRISHLVHIFIIEKDTPRSILLFKSGNIILKKKNILFLETVQTKFKIFLHFL